MNKIQYTLQRLRTTPLWVWAAAEAGILAVIFFANPHIFHIGIVEPPSKLESLLRAGRWKEADAETDRIIYRLADEHDNDGSLYYSPLEITPCKDLRYIDRLWVKHSNGRYGFSIQIKNYWATTNFRDVISKDTGQFPTLGQEMFKSDVRTESGVSYALEYMNICGL